MKEKKAMEAMRRWSGGEFAKAVAIFTRQAALDPERTRLCFTTLRTKLFRSDELMPAIEARLKKGSW